MTISKVNHIIVPSLFLDYDFMKLTDKVVVTSKEPIYFVPLGDSFAIRKPKKLIGMTNHFSTVNLCDFPVKWVFLMHKTLWLSMISTYRFSRIYSLY